MDCRSIPTVPTYAATQSEMDDFPSLISSLGGRLNQFGAVLVQPPVLWTPAPSVLTDSSTYTIKEQIFPVPPFADRSVMSSIKGFIKPSEIGVNRLVQDDNGRITDLSLTTDELTNEEVSVYSEVSSLSRHRNRSSNFESSQIQHFQRSLSTGNRLPPRLTTDDIENIFWRMMKSGVDGDPVRSWYGSDVAIDTIGKGVNTKRPRSTSHQSSSGENGTSRATSKWNIRNLNTQGLLRHAEQMHGINIPMYYAGGAFSYFPYHVEDEDLCSLSYLHYGSPKIWYVTPPSNKISFERFVGLHVLNPQFVNKSNNGARQFLSEKSCLFNPLLPKQFQDGLSFYKVVHIPGTFVILPPCAYHGGFNTGFNVAEAVNYADMSWLTPARVVSKSVTSERLPYQVSLPIEYMFWKEAESVIQRLSSISPSSPSLLKSGRLLHDALSIIFRQSKRKIFHHTGDNASNVLLLSTVEIDHSSGIRGFPCSACGRPAYFWVQICGTCLDPSHLRCISHLTMKFKDICSVPGHRPTFVRRFTSEEFQTVLTQLAALVPSHNQSRSYSLLSTDSSSRNPRTASRNRRRSKRRKYNAEDDK